MLLRDAFRHQGDWLFRHRSFLPLLLAPLAVIAVLQSGGFERLLGHFWEDFWEPACVLISLAGLLLRMVTVGSVPRGTSGRNRHKQRAEVLNTTGVYSICRNPLYLGNFLVIMGLVLLPGVWWFALIVVLAFWLYYERIIYAEEAFLEETFGQAYRDWAARTPVFIPNPLQWRPSDRELSISKILRQEYSGLYVIVLFSSLTDMSCDIFSENETLSFWVRDDMYWVGFFALGTLTYLGLRFVRHHTPYLKAQEPLLK